MNFSIRAITKHKTYQRNFLIWVAYVRKVSQKIGENERRTCPLEACKAAPFDTHDAMLQHVYTCPHLARGSYKCCECGKSERISKIHTDGCHELRRFSTVRNSLRRAKRLLSSHGPKTRNASECAPNKQIISEKIAVLPTQTDSYNTIHSDLHLACTELEALWTPEIHELEMAMSAACANSLIFDQPQITCSELSARHDHAQVSQDHQPEMEHAPVELSTGYNSTWKPAANESQQNSRQPQSLSDGVPARTLDVQQDWPQDHFEVSSRYTTLLDGTGLTEIRSPVSPISWHDHSSCLSLSSSATRTNTDTSAVSSGSFYSTRETSMSSISSFNPQPEDHEKPALRFFTESGVSMMFSEPEPMGESIEPMELPTFANTHCRNWFGEVSGSVFSEPEAMEEPAELIAANLPISPSAPQLPYLLDELNARVPMIELMGDSVQPVELPSHSKSHFSQRNEALKSTKEPLCMGIPPWNTGAQILSKLSPIPLTGLSDPSPPPVSKDPSSKYKCSCGFEPTGKEVYKPSNLKRHQSTRACRRFSPYQRSETTKSWQCPYPDCPKRFTRSDNLRVHQKQKRHFIEVELRTGPFLLRPDSNAHAVREMLERHRYQGVESRDPGGF